MKILILDYSVTKFETALIKQWLPSNAEVHAYYVESADSIPLDLIDQAFTHIIHSGSELSINEEAPFTERAERLIRLSRETGAWQFGICYGHQLLGKALIGPQAVRKSPNGFEAGWKAVQFEAAGMELLNTRSEEWLWQHHFDEVTILPEGSVQLARNAHSEIQAYINFDQHLLGTQFHPEFDQERGNDFFINDRALLEKHHFNVEKMISSGPSFDAGNVFFEVFLSQGRK